MTPPFLPRDTVSPSPATTPGTAASTSAYVYHLGIIFWCLGLFALSLYPYLYLRESRRIREEASCAVVKKESDIIASTNANAMALVCMQNLPRGLRGIQRPLLPLPGIPCQGAERLPDNPDPMRNVRSVDRQLEGTASSNHFPRLDDTERGAEPEEIFEYGHSPTVCGGSQS